MSISNRKSTIKTTGVKGGGQRGTKAVPVPDYFVGGQSSKQFAGLVTALVDPKKPIPGSYVDGKNWITGQLLDHMELRGGTNLIGTGIGGAGKVRGLGVGTRVDGTQLLFRARGQKIEWCNISKTGAVVTDWTEVGGAGANILPIAAINDMVSIVPYNGLSGAFVYVSSINSSIYKIPVANPSSYIDLNSTTYRGTIIISQNRMHLWGRKTAGTGFMDLNTHYVSHTDRSTVAGFTVVTNELVGNGDGITKTFAGTQASRTGIRTSFAQTVTDGVETFIDDQNGNLLGTLGGVGTINYATGAYSVTFNTAPAQITKTASTISFNTAQILDSGNGFVTAGFLIGQKVKVTGSASNNNIFTITNVAAGILTVAEAVVIEGAGASMTLATVITTSYFWEDATSGGVADFSYTSPTRLAGEGNFFNQNDGGPMQISLPYNGTWYDLHLLKSWALTLDSTDLASTNLQWRDKLGISAPQAAYANADGITMLDYTDAQNPRLRAFGLNAVGTLDFSELSDQLNLSPYEYSYAIVIEFSNYDLLFCQAKTLGVADPYNSLLFIRNKVSGSWDKLQVPAACVVKYNGMLIAGDFTSNNCYQLFSGFDDEGYIIDNYVTFSQWNLGVPGQKKSHRFEADIFIGPAQILQFLVSYDNSPFTEIFRMNGSDPQVDANLGAVIGGTSSIGSDVVGSSGVPNAFHYGREVTISSDRFEQMQIQVKALGIGPVSINYFGPKDNRYKGRRKLPQYNQP